MRLIKSIPTDGAVTRLRTSTDRYAVLSVHNKRRICIWTASELSLLGEFRIDHDVFAYALSPDHRTLAVTTLSNDLFLFDVPTGTLRNHVDTKHHGVEFLSDDLLAAVRPKADDNSFDQEVCFYDFALTPTKTFPMPYPEVGWEMRSMPHEGLLLINGIGVTIWNTATTELVRDVNCDTLSPDWDIWETCCFDVLPDSSVMAVGFDRWSGPGPRMGPVICTVDVSTGRAIEWVDRLFACPDCPTCISLSSDGLHLSANVHGHASTFVWDTRTAKHLGTITQPDASASVFVDDHRILVGAGHPDPLTLWEI